MEKMFEKRAKFFCSSLYLHFAGLVGGDGNARIDNIDSIYRYDYPTGRTFSFCCTPHLNQPATT